MLFQNLSFHNVSELTLDEKGGYLLHRMPLEAELSCYVGAQGCSRSATGCEIRFVPLEEEVEITLACDSSQPVLLYDGSFPSGWRKANPILTGEGITLKLGRCAFYDTIARIHAQKPFSFSPEVIRILLPAAPVRFLGVKGKVRPPRADELPAKTYFAYGSSITNGSLAIGNNARYATQLAERLGYDCRVLSFPGSARLELPQAEVIANMDFDFATLEMGINMIDYFTVEEFERIARKFLSTIVQAHPHCPIFCIDMFYNHNDINQNPLSPAFRSVIRKLVCEVDSDKVIYLNGLTLLNDISALTADLVHPNSYGHTLIAQNLERAVRPFL